MEVPALDVGNRITLPANVLIFSRDAASQQLVRELNRFSQLINTLFTTDIAQALHLLHWDDINVVVATFMADDDTKASLRLLAQLYGMPKHHTPKIILIGDRGKSIAPQMFSSYERRAFKWFLEDTTPWAVCLTVLKAAQEHSSGRLVKGWREIAQLFAQAVDTIKADREFEPRHSQTLFRILAANCANIQEHEDDSEETMFFVHCRTAADFSIILWVLATMCERVLFTCCPGPRDFGEGQDIASHRLYKYKAQWLTIIRAKDFFDQFAEVKPLLENGCAAFVPVANFVCEERSVAVPSGDSPPTFSPNRTGIGMLWGDEFGAFQIECGKESVFSCISREYITSVEVPILLEPGMSSMSAALFNDSQIRLADIRAEVTTLLAGLNSTSSADFARNYVAQFAARCNIAVKKMRPAGWPNEDTKLSLAAFHLSFAVLMPEQLASCLRRYSAGPGLFPALYAGELTTELREKARPFYVLGHIDLDENYCPHADISWIRRMARGFLKSFGRV